MQDGASDAAEAASCVFPSSVPEPCSRNLCSAIKASSCSSADTVTDGISEAITVKTLSSQHQPGAPRIARKARDPTTKGDATETRDKQATHKYKSNLGTEATADNLCIDTGQPQVNGHKDTVAVPGRQIHAEAKLGKTTPEAEPSRAPKGKKQNLAVHLKASTIHSETFPNGALTWAVP